MEVIRGRERDCRQEVRGAVEHGGTRPTRRVDPQRQAFRPAADEGPHPAEGGRIGARRRLERQPDCRGARHQHRHYRADQAPTESSPMAATGPRKSCQPIRATRSADGSTRTATASTTYSKSKRAASRGPGPTRKPACLCTSTISLSSKSASTATKPIRISFMTKSHRSTTL